MPSLANLSIRAKVLSVPTLLVALLLGLAAYAFLLLGTNEGKVRAVNEGIVRNSAIVTTFNVDLQTSLSKLYRLTSMAANVSDQAKIQQMTEAAAADLDAFSGALPGVKTAALGSGIAADRADALDQAMAAYVKAAKFAINMAKTDSSAALTFMTGAEHKFNDVDKILDEILKQQNQTRDGAVGGIYADMSRGRTVFVTVSLAIAALALLVSLPLSAMISRPIVSMTAALGQIANKNYATPIPALGQSDEIGRMAKAVGITRRRFPPWAKATRSAAWPKRWKC